MLRSLLLAATLGLTLLVASPTAARAQSAPALEELSQSWMENIGPQLAEMLRSPSEEQREEALLLLIDLKRRYGAQVDVTAATPAVLTLTETGPTTGHRMLAITALYEMRDPNALQTLAEQVVNDPPSPVRRHAARILAAYRATVQ
jgi:HEAT repeat protein